MVEFSWSCALFSALWLKRWHVCCGTVEHFSCSLWQQQRLEAHSSVSMSIHLSRTQERNISRTPWRHFFEIGANVHLDARMNWFDSGGSKVKITVAQSSSYSCKCISRKCLKGFSFRLTQSLSRHACKVQIHRFTESWYKTFVHTTGTSNMKDLSGLKPYLLTCCVKRTQLPHPCNPPPSSSLLSVLQPPGGRSRWWHGDDEGSSRRTGDQVRKGGHKHWAGGRVDRGEKARET